MQVFSNLNNSIILYVWFEVLKNVLLLLLSQVKKLILACLQQTLFGGLSRTAEAKRFQFFFLLLLTSAVSLFSW